MALTSSPYSSLRWLLVACTVFLLLSARGGRALAEAATEPLREVEAVVATFARENHVPAISVAVMRGNELIFAQGFGLAQRERDAPASAATIYQTGSIAKSFTAAAILRLVEQRRLSLEDTLVRWLPDFGHVGGALRLRHLLQQTSGLREYFTIPAVKKGLPDLTRPQRELVDHIRREPLVFSPGERWSYSNSNYTLLSLVIERASGVSYDEFLAREFLRPLGLGSIRSGTPLPQSGGEARG